MENLEIYEKVRAVPKEAQREIAAGRLKGKTDINPMWRIKALTELFGPCGIGWKYTIDRQWTETGASGEIAAFCNISLYFADPTTGAWSEAIPGSGGSALVAQERNGPFTSDECYKMALTDAISVACKALGVGADIYWQKDPTKYDCSDESPETPPNSDLPPQSPKPTDKISETSANRIIKGLVAICGKKVEDQKCLLEGISDGKYSNVYDITVADVQKIYDDLIAMAKEIKKDKKLLSEEEAAKNEADNG